MKKISTLSMLFLAICAFCLVLMRTCGGTEKVPEPTYTPVAVTVQPTEPALQETPTPVVLTTPEPVEIDLWTTDGVNLRRSADGSSDILTVIPSDTKLRRLEYPNGKWVKVRHEELEGYVSTDYVSSIDPAALTPTESAKTPSATSTPTESTFEVTPCSDVVYATDGVNLRRGPGKDYEVAGSVNKDTKLERTGTTANGWSRVLYNSVGYFVSSDFVTTTAPEGEDTENAEAGSLSFTPSVTSSGSGEFKSDNDVALNLIVRWTATPAADGNFDLSLSASLLSGPLSAAQYPDSLCFSVGGNTYYKTAPAIAIDEGSVETPLGSQTVTVPGGNVPVSVSWSFKGTYSGKEIDKLTAGTNLYLK